MLPNVDSSVIKNEKFELCWLKAENAAFRGELDHKKTWKKFWPNSGNLQVQENFDSSGSVGDHYELADNPS